MARTDPITQSRLKKLLSYDPATGVFIWRVSPSNNVPAGSVAGTTLVSGYRYIKIDGTPYQAHRLAFLYMTGDFPPNEVDHRNGVTDDNRWKNLRPATHGQNQRNTKPCGASKFKGVSWDKDRGKWKAQAWFNGKKHHLGLHDTEKAAAAAYAAFAMEHFPEWARLV